jgi:organic radical activating enzyme
MVFVRLAGCPWRCRYCDTPGSLAFDSGEEMGAEEVLVRVRGFLDAAPHGAVSFTGGEPLMQTEFLGVLLKGVRALDAQTYLETAGTHPLLLRRVIADVDAVSMDVKLPSAIGRSFWEEHREFLAVAAGKVFVKIVLTDTSTDDELSAAFTMISAAVPTPTAVLQPATERTVAVGGDSEVLAGPPSSLRLATIEEWARRVLPDVRTIPQMHPLWGLP